MKEVIERLNWLAYKCEDKAITPDVKDDVKYILEEVERLNNIIKQQNTRNSRQRIANKKLLEKNQDLVIENLKSNNLIDELEKENEILKHRLNDIIFDDANNDVELGARYLRKIGYIDFDEDRKVYINKHNNEPFWQEDEREKGYYIPDEELDEYTKQLEKKLQQKENIIKEVREYIKEHIRIDYDYPNYMEMLLEEYKELLEILDKTENI